MYYSSNIGEELVLLSIRFVGEELNVRSVPIYDLGQCLTAIQRLTNKAYLSRQGRLFTDTSLRPEERRSTSLQIAGKRNGSDIYDIVAFVTNPFMMHLIFDVVVVFSYYSYRKVFVPRINESDQVRQLPIFKDEDEYTSYEDGINLLTRLNRENERVYHDVLVYEQRLRENIKKARRYGDNENYRSDRTSIVDQLNQLTLNTIDMPFLEVCRSAPNLLVNYREDTREEILTRASYKEVKAFTQRIDKSGIINAIELQPSITTGLGFIEIDQETKDYVKSIETQFFLGDVQRIEGRVTKLYLDSNSIEIVRGARDNIKITLASSDFEKIRRETTKNPIITFIGRPKYKIGLENTGFNEFEASQIVLE